MKDTDYCPVCGDQFVWWWGKEHPKSPYRVPFLPPVRVSKLGDASPTSTPAETFTVCVQCYERAGGDDWELFMKILRRLGVFD